MLILIKQTLPTSSCDRYGSAHTSHVLDVVVKHQTGAAGTRYKVNYPAKKALDKLQRDGNAAIREFVGRTFPGVHCDEPVGMVGTCTSILLRVETLEVTLPLSWYS